MTNAHADWWKQAVVYQVYPRSFYDANGDGLGDIAGVTAKIDYLAALGVDAIWLSPFYPSPLIDGGYDVANYRDVDPRLGTLEDFDKMAEAAHAAWTSCPTIRPPSTNGSARRSQRAPALRSATAISSVRVGASMGSCPPTVGSRPSAALHGSRLATASGICTSSL